MRWQVCLLMYVVSSLLGVLSVISIAYADTNVLKVLNTKGLPECESNDLLTYRIVDGVLFELPKEIRDEVVSFFAKQKSEDFKHEFEKAEKVIVHIKRYPFEPLRGFYFTYFTINKTSIMDGRNWCLGYLVVNGSGLPNESVARWLNKKYVP